MSIELIITDKKYDNLRRGFVYVNTESYNSLCEASNITKGNGPLYVKINDKYFNLYHYEQIEKNAIYFNLAGRMTVYLPFNTLVNVVTVFDEKKYLSSIDIEIGYYRGDENKRRFIDCDTITTSLRKKYIGQYLNNGQHIYKMFNFPDKVAYKLIVRNIDYGILSEETEIKYERHKDSPIVLEGAGQNMDKLFKIPKFDFQSMGIGGLDKEFNDIFRRVFATRYYSSKYMRKLGITHVKGIMLHGPPGCGKTLIARQLGKCLNCVEPKIVNGPDIFDKFVGGSEENIRNLFIEAENDYSYYGDTSPLHVIIFDEIDSICRKRGSASGGTGVKDSVVNQLLSKIDGVDSLNNIIIIGMTNRLDMIDPAILRPGRFEMKMEIGLPNRDGRVQILNIHTNSLNESGIIDDGVSIDDLADRTNNYTGAEIAGVCRAATSFALNREIDFDDDNKKPNEKNVKIYKDDFIQALDELKPVFGKGENFERLYDQGLIPYNEDFTILKSRLDTYTKQIITSTKKGTVKSCLLNGYNGSGKTALAANIAQESGFTFVKMICPRKMIGMSDMTKVNFINDIFNDAYRTNLAMIIIDDVDTLLDYIEVGHSVTFSNKTLQCLFILLKERPPTDCNLFVLVTTTNYECVKTLKLVNIFNNILHIPMVCNEDCENFDLDELTKDKFDEEFDDNKASIKDVLSLIDRINFEKS